VRFLALPLLAVVLLVAGCGGGSSRLSKQDFETHLNRDAVLAAKAATGASTADFNSPDVYARRIVLAQKDMTKAADDLDSIKPPADAEKDVATIVAGLRYLSKALGRLHDAAVAKSFTKAQKVSTDIQTSPEVKGVAIAIAGLERKGYDVGAFGG
jgi:hypothetical protein